MRRLRRPRLAASAATGAVTARRLTGSQARGVRPSAHSIAIHRTWTLRTSAVSTRMRLATGRLATAIGATELLASVRDTDSPGTQTFARACARRFPAATSWQSISSPERPLRGSAPLTRYQECSERAWQRLRGRRRTSYRCGAGRPCSRATRGLCVCSATALAAPSWSRLGTSRLNRLHRLPRGRH